MAPRVDLSGEGTSTFGKHGSSCEADEPGLARVGLESCSDRMTRDPEPELARLRDLAERNLSHADGDGEFVFGLQALMAFEDGGVWQRHLQAVANGEITMECPSCHDFVVMNLEGTEFRMASFADASVGSTPVSPVEPSLDSPAQRIIALSRRYGFDGVAATVPYLLGNVLCPSCRDRFDLPDALV